jgi:hypothetical protein
MQFSKEERGVFYTSTKMMLGDGTSTLFGKTCGSTGKTTIREKEPDILTTWL